jgi:hypothetical protein
MKKAMRVDICSMRPGTNVRWEFRLVISILGKKHVPKGQENTFGVRSESGRFGGQSG